MYISLYTTTHPHSLGCAYSKKHQSGMHPPPTPIALQLAAYIQLPRAPSRHAALLVLLAHRHTRAHLHARYRGPTADARSPALFHFFITLGGAMCREARSSCIRKLAFFVFLTLLFVRLPLIFLNSPTLSFFFIISFVLLFCLWPPPIFFPSFWLILLAPSEVPTKEVGGGG